jgi:hypothetical protein
MLPVTGSNSFYVYGIVDGSDRSGFIGMTSSHSCDSGRGRPEMAASLQHSDVECDAPSATR